LIQRRVGWLFVEQADQVIKKGSSDISGEPSFFAGSRMNF
jgi:hypothetical protein